jgi:DNA-binding MarR family transcriptional regulator/predicted GNAT family acetyltransferase
MTIYKNAGLLILGTRLKRISERFLSEVAKVYKEQKIEFEPAWFPILFLLDKKGPLSLTEIASELEVSHSAVSQMISQLQNKSIVEPISQQADARVKRIFFTLKGQSLLNQTHDIWKALAQTLDQILPKETQSLFLDSLSNIEEKIASGFLSNHTLSLLGTLPINIICLETDPKNTDKLLKWAKKRNINLELDNNRFLIATHHNNIVGFSTYLPIENAIDLKCIFVSSDYQQQGVGTNLIKTLYESYLEKKNGYFQLNVPSLELIKLLIKTNYSFKVN